jgi:hypothetical protein
VCNNIYAVTVIFHQTHLYVRHCNGSEVSVPEDQSLRMTRSFVPYNKTTDRLCSVHGAIFRRRISQRAVVPCVDFTNKNLSTRVSCFSFISAHWPSNICHFNPNFHTSFIIFPHCHFSYFLPILFTLLFPLSPYRPISWTKISDTSHKPGIV